MGSCGLLWCAREKQRQSAVPGPRTGVLHPQLHPHVTCVLCFDVLLVLDGVGKGLVTGAALQ